MKKNFLITVSITYMLLLLAVMTNAQGWIANTSSTPDIMYSVDPSNSASGVYVGVGTNAPYVRLMAQQGSALTPFSAGNLPGDAGILSTDVTFLGTAQGSGNQNVGILGYAKNNSSVNTGVTGVSEGGTTPNNTGVNGAVRGDCSTGAGINIGVQGSVFGSQSGSGTLLNYAGNFDAATGTSSGNGTNYGVYAQVNGGATNGSTNYAVYGDALGANNYWAGYFNGYLFSTHVLQVSDRKFKQNIQDITNAIDVIKQLQPKQYTFDRDKYPGVALPEGENYGLIAQDVEKILPSLVKDNVNPGKRDMKTGKVIYDKVEFKCMNYISLIPFLIQGMKEQQTVIEKLSNDLQELKGNTQVLPSGNLKETFSYSAKDRAQLFQNHPNPFSQSTEIGFYIPESSQRSMLNVYDFQGKQLRSIPLNQKGDGKITVAANELGAGMYFYSLIVDGVEVATKKMILTD